MTTLPAPGPVGNTGRPVRRPRLRPPAAPCPSHQPSADPAARHTAAIAAEAARVARREVLVNTRTNAAGHAVLAAAAQLLDALDEFQRAADSPEVYQKLRRAGLAPDGPTHGEEFGADFFEDAADAALGFEYSVKLFADAIRAGLTRHPDKPGPCTCKR